MRQEESTGTFPSVLKAEKKQAGELIPGPFFGCCLASAADQQQENDQDTAIVPTSASIAVAESESAVAVSAEAG